MSSRRMQDLAFERRYSLYRWGTLAVGVFLAVVLVVVCVVLLMGEPHFTAIVASVFGSLLLALVAAFGVIEVVRRRELRDLAARRQVRPPRVPRAHRSTRTGHLEAPPAYDTIVFDNPSFWCTDSSNDNCSQTGGGNCDPGGGGGCDGGGGGCD